MTEQITVNPDKNTEQILATEYSTEFDDKRKRAMVTSFYKYGRVGENYSKRLDTTGKDYTMVQSIPTLKLCLQRYEETGNLDYLVDVANYAMIEYMFPQHKDAHYRAGTREKDSAGQVGLSVREAQQIASEGDKE